MKHKRKILVAFVSTAIVLSVAQVVFSTSFTTAGIDLNALQNEKKSIDKENMILGEDLYTKSSFTTIAQEAETEGFVQDPKSRITLSNTSAVAIAQ